jgi:hypothetical protein
VMIWPSAFARGQIITITTTQKRGT